MASMFVLLLQLLLASLASASHHYGGTSTFTYKGQNPDGSFRVDIRERATFHSCQHHYWSCYSGNCGRNIRTQNGVLDSSTNAPPYNSQWCETETVSTRNLWSDKPFQMRAHSCCWIPTRNSVNYWNLLRSVDLGTRSDTGKPNKSPEIAILPFLRVPQNCPRTYKLMSFDPDGDKVRCRYGNIRNVECSTCNQPSGFHLDQDSCTLRYVSSSASSRVDAFEMVVEDFPQRSITLAYSDGSRSTRSPLTARRRRQAFTSYPTTTPFSTTQTRTVPPGWGWTTTHGTTTTAAPTTTPASSTTPWWWTTTHRTTTTTPPTIAPWWWTTTQWWTTTTSPTTTTPPTTTSPPTTTPWWSTTTWWWTTTTPPTTTSPSTTTTTTPPTTTTTTPPTTTSPSTTTTTTTTPPTTTTTTPPTTTTSPTTTTTTPPTTTTTTSPTTTTTTSPTTTTTPWWSTTTRRWTTTTPPTTTTTTSPTTTTTPWWSTTTRRWPTTTTTPPYATTPLSKLPLHFSLLVDSPAPSCVEGFYLPKFLNPTPENGARIQAEVNKEVEIRVKAQAAYARLDHIIISGPLNISKHKTTHDEFVIRWTPTADDLGEHYPICFAVESESGSAVYQSEMRCVLVDIVKEHINSNVICTESTMTVEVEKSSFSGLHEDHLRLNDPTDTACSLQRHSNSTHIIAVIPLNACGTQIEEDADNLIFKNEITTVDSNVNLITRKHLLEVQFYCQYPKRGNVSVGFTAHRKNVTVWDKGFGMFTYQFEFYPNNQFQTMIDPNSYPLEYDLGSRIYMQIEATTTVNNTELFVESCRAAPYDNPNYRPTYSIIENGCKVDSTVEIHSPTHEREFKFSMEAFKFIGLHDQVYISCSVLMCVAGEPNTRCSQGCINSTQSGSYRHHQRKREVVTQSSRHQISQGPLRLRRSAERAESPVVNLNLNLVFIAGCLLAAVGMISAVTMYKAKVSKVKYQPLPAFES